MIRYLLNFLTRFIGSVASSSHVPYSYAHIASMDFSFRPGAGEGRADAWSRLFRRDSSLGLRVGFRFRRILSRALGNADLMGFAVGFHEHDHQNRCKKGKRS